MPALRGRGQRALVALVFCCRALLAQAADTDVPDPSATFLSIGPAVQVVAE